MSDPSTPTPEDGPELRAIRDEYTVPRVLEHALEHAVRAPSTHNAQPWAFEVEGPTVRVFADQSRALPVCDPDGRELSISLGCLVHHLRVALAHLGRPHEVRYLPDRYDPDLVAEITAGAQAPESLENEALFRSIAQRHTNRGAYAPDAIPAQVLDAIRAAARAEGGELVVLEAEADRARLADLVTEADRIQQSDPLFREELAQWLNPTPSKRTDGVLIHAPVVGPLVPWIVRTFDRGDGEAAAHRHIALGSPVLAVLCTEGDDARARVRAGEALSRSLLVACDWGVSASYLNQALELPDLRASVAELVSGGRAPQIVLRLGYGTSAPRTSPRRSAQSCTRPPRAP